MTHTLKQEIAQMREWANGEGCFNDNPEGEPLPCVYWAQQPFLALCDRLDEAREMLFYRYQTSEAFGEQCMKDIESLLARAEAAEQRVREVEALPAKWRNQPDSGQPEAVCECADDLEAALQGTGSGSADNG